jgi:S-DNA-T family DNA segregation ATPase FtsK/SpoIIIE
MGFLKRLFGGGTPSTQDQATEGGQEGSIEPNSSPELSEIEKSPHAKTNCGWRNEPDDQPKESSTASIMQAIEDLPPYDPKSALEHYLFPYCELLAEDNHQENPASIGIRQLFSSEDYLQAQMELPCAVGLTDLDKPFIFDLALLPHLLLSGTTGSGKSTALEVIMTSLLFKKHPEELKFVLIDTKQVELNFYKSLEQHFLATLPDGNPIVSDSKEAAQVLNALCMEMNQRLKLLRLAQVKDIKAYNKKFCDRKLNPEQGHYYLPYLVVIIDELAGLMMSEGKAVEDSLLQLSQMARPAGIHLVMATGRPSTDILTSSIKANIPGRASFKMVSKRDSMVILDRPGAERLSAVGEMFFLEGTDLTRVRCAYISTEEIVAINEFIAAQAGYHPFSYWLPDSSTNDIEAEDTIVPEMLDPLFREAAELIVATQQGSTSLIQRKYAIGYNRSGRLMDQLERWGIVGPAKGSAPREVLVKDLQELNRLLATIQH